MEPVSMRLPACEHSHQGERPCDLRATFDRASAASTDGILIITARRMVCYCNGAAERILGRPAGELLGAPLRVPLGEGGGVETSLVGPEGRELIVEVRTIATEWAGEPAQLVLLRDVTERRRLEQELRQAHKMEALGALAGGIAHDFNNLLTSILSYSGLLVEQLAADDARHRYATKIRAVAHRAAALTGQLLTFSRRKVVQAQVLDLNDIVRETGSLLTRLIGETTTLEITASDRPALVKIDRSQMEQVLMNLAVNARDAMPAGGRLSYVVGVEDATGVPTEGNAEGGRLVVLTVRDTGCGMDAATQQRIFEPFFTTKPDGQGTGLGLSIVYGIVLQAGGGISLHSAPGQGTVFRIQLPSAVRVSAEAVPEPAGPHGAVTHAHHGANILLVEDDEEIRTVVTELLGARGYQVEAAENGAVALAILQTSAPRFDLVITDLVMPVMGGQELAQHIHRSLPELPILFVSGYSKQTLSDAYQSSQHCDFLGKPFAPAALQEKVARLLRLRGERLAAQRTGTARAVLSA